MEEHAETIKTEVVEGAKEWAIIEIVKQAVLKLVSMLNPAGAIVQAIMAIFNTVMFFMNPDEYREQQVTDYGANENKNICRKGTPSCLSVFNSRVFYPC